MCNYVNFRLFVWLLVDSGYQLNKTKKNKEKHRVNDFVVVSINIRISVLKCVLRLNGEIQYFVSKLFLV